MTDDPNIHKLRPVSLADIPGQLRQMATSIEQGQFVGQSALFILIDQEKEQEDWPAIFGWGEALGDFQTIGVLEICKTWFVTNKAKRYS